MKKSILALICVLSILSSTFASMCVSAQNIDSTVNYTYEENYLPKPHYREVSLYSDSVEQQLEELLIAGWGNVDKKIDISSLKIPVGDFKEMYYSMIYENPQFYYVQTGYGLSTNGEIVLTVSPSYKISDKNEIAQTMAGIEKEKQNILSFIDEDMTDFGKVMTVHDYLTLNYYYDLTYSNYDTSIMVTKTGVCQAYALAFKLIMNELDIPCTFVSSDEMEHAWNLVMVDGKWYHIDVTWGDPTPDQFAKSYHTYALLSTDRIMSLDNPHTGFDLGDLTADSTVYDDAPWHNTTSAIVSLGANTYYIDRENNQIKLLDGTVVVDKLAGNDGKWNIPDSVYFYSNSYAALSKYDGKLIYSTDTSINTYDPTTDETAVFKDIAGLNAMYINNNILYYSKFEYQGMNENNTSPIIATVKGELLLSNENPVPTVTPIPTVKPTATPTPSVKPTVTPTATVKPTATPTPSVKPTVTPTQINCQFIGNADSVTFTITNSDTEIENIVTILVLYDENDNIVKIKVGEQQTIKANETVSHTIESDGVSFKTIKAFNWENLDQIKPLFNIASATLQ